MHVASEGHIICCTTKSLDRKGDPLITLPLCNIIKTYLDLMEQETAIINKQQSAFKDKYVLGFM